MSGPCGAPRLWYVTLTVGGEPQDPPEVQAALERLTHQHPFLLDGRFGPDRAELRYWEEGELCEDACAMALRLWGEFRTSAGLPAWSVLGLEVVDRETLWRRGVETPPGRSGADRAVALAPPASGAASWRPFG